MLLVLFAGALGSYIHAIKSLVDYIGNQTAKESWFWFYMTRPFVGMALALIFYAVIRGGFLAGTPADAKSVNPFGVVALAGLVGMFADKASQKLSEVFDADVPHRRHTQGQTGGAGHRHRRPAPASVGKRTASR